jgi:hypothetical protein
MARNLDIGKTKFHLLAVSVAADLALVKTQGEAISLEAMNAKVLVARAGAMALGFRPITDFMVQLAASTIRLVQEIEKEALAVSHHSVARLRTNDAVLMAQKAQSLADASGARYRQQIEAFVAQTIERDIQTNENVLDHTQKLILLLEEIVELMMAASAVSSSARVESAAIDIRFSQSFQSVSNKLDQCSTTVSEKVKTNLAVLEKALSVQRR